MPVSVVPASPRCQSLRFEYNSEYSDLPALAKGSRFRLRGFNRWL